MRFRLDLRGKPTLRNAGIVCVRALNMFVLLSLGARAGAQPAAPVRSPGALTLGALHEEALASDPRVAQLQLEAARTELRLQSIAVERRPSFRIDALGQYQSDVPTPPSPLPGGQPLWAPPHQTVDGSLRIEQPLVSPSIAPRLAVERAALAESQARVRTAVFGRRQEVNEAFFGAALLQERMGALRATITVLDDLLEDAAVRVRERTALPSEAASIEAVRLERRRDLATLAADRRAALARLSELTTRTLGEGTELSLPDLGEAVLRARTARPTLRARPEFDQFGRTRDRLDEQGLAARAQERPRVNAFGRVGYGKPGLNFIANEFDTYWTAGIQVQWTPWTWGTSDREQAALALQQRIVDADEAAFRSGLERAVQDDLAALDRLEGTATLDDQIVALRETVDRETRLRLDERVASAAQYLDQSTDLLDARLARASHVVELARARARVLTTLGVEVR
jgi:outer membrane protein TolC